MSKGRARLITLLGVVAVLTICTGGTTFGAVLLAAGIIVVLMWATPWGGRS